MSRKILCYILLFITFYNTDVKAQENTETILDLEIRMLERYSKISPNIITSSSTDAYEALKSILDTLDEKHLVGATPAIIIDGLISNAKARKDTIMAITHLADLRNRVYRELQQEISNSFYYGMNTVTSNKWIGESELAMGIFRNNAMQLLLWSPNEATTQFAYEALMHNKGLSLAADNNFKFMAIESGNKEIKSLYRRLIRAQQTYDELFSKYTSDFAKYKDEFDDELCDFPRLKKLRTVIPQIKDSIFDIANTDYLYINKFFISWKQIQDKLSDNEICIEFSEIKLDSLNSRYVALLIDKSHPYPQFFNLCNKESIKNVDVKQDNGLNKLFEQIWEPMMEALKNKDKIYFSPDGLLYSLPLEYALPNKTLCRISNSKELLKLNDSKDHLNIVAYGGLDYDSKETPLNDSHSISRGTSSSGVIRGVRGSLPGSLAEVEKIKGIVTRKNNTTIRIYKGKEGTEESFYKLEDSNFNILHISTHGFYYTPEDIEERKSEKNKYSFIDFNNENLEASLMTHSGLLLSGANHVLRGENIPKGSEDGVLTAKEIADTNLSFCDMVVLSACQSGLGIITTEGVYGLQLGFKKAGVHTILMSLWDVDDNATQILLVEFYRQLLAGVSAHNSLKIAQQHLRQQGLNYQNPYYWAGFIPLDALN